MRRLAFVLALFGCGDDDGGNAHVDAPVASDAPGDGAQPVLFADPPLHITVTQAIPHALAVRDLDGNGTDDPRDPPRR